MCSFKFDRCRWRTSLSPPKLIEYTNPFCPRSSNKLLL
jgi:hypothetical protein